MPNEDKILKIENEAQVKWVFSLYDELEQTLTILSIQVEHEPDRTRLLQEILNDYLGYYADFVWPRLADMEKLGFHVGYHSKRFDELIRKRLELEGLGFHNWLDPSWVKRGTAIDYRGLCYTYNYVQRGYEHLQRHEDAIDVGLMSFTLNDFIGDHLGKQICAGVLSKSFINSGSIDRSLYWAQQSVAYAQVYNLHVGVPLRNLAMICEATNQFTPFFQLSRMISYRHIVRHFDEALPLSVRKRLLLRGDEFLSAHAEIGSKFFWGQPVDFNFLDSVVKVLQNTDLERVDRVEVNGIQVRVSGMSNADGKREFNLIFPTVIGRSHIVPIEPDSQTELISRGSDVVYGIRGMEPIETNRCALVILEYSPGSPWHIVTAHPGDCSPPLPSNRESLEKDSFWAHHAFIIS